MEVHENIEHISVLNVMMFNLIDLGVKSGA